MRATYRTHRIANMPLQSLLPMLMHCMPFPNLIQAIPHQKLIIPRRKQRGRHIDQNRNPTIIQISETFPAEEYGGHDTRAKISGEVRGDSDVGKGPDHGAISEAYGEGRTGGGNEWVGRIEACPDHEADVGVYEEFGEEEVAEIPRQCQ